MQKTEGDTAPAMIHPTMVLVKWTYQSNRNPSCAAASGAQAQWCLVHLLCVETAFLVCLKHLLTALLHHHLPSPPCSTFTSCNHGLTMVSSRVLWQGSVDLWTKKDWWVHFPNHCLTMVSSRVVWQNMCFPNYKWRKVWGPKNKQNKLQRYWTTTDCTHSKRNTVKYTQIFLPQWSDCLNLCKEVHTSLPIEVQISSKGCPGSCEKRRRERALELEYYFPIGQHQSHVETCVQLSLI